MKCKMHVEDKKDLEKSVAERILIFLKEKDAIVKDLSEGLDLSENVIRTTINRMKEKDLVQETGVFRDRFKIYRIGGLSEREVIKKDFLERLLEAIQNRGKRQIIYRKYKDDIDKFYSEEDIDMKMGFFVELLIQTAKKELVEDPKFIEELADKIEFTEDSKLIEELAEKIEFTGNPEFLKKLKKALEKLK